ncbi:MAG: hypothetical protein QOD24_4333 [Solirubrobacteraceae bacterium]|nr:hypothetical protein [Solirubrobacteraceae bacterium]
MTSISLNAARRRRPKPATADAGAVLAIVLACYLMIILDASVVITALPQIHDALGFSPTSLSWVQNAYTLTFGGLMLLGARAGDLLGRRRMFVAGIAVFTGASLLAGLAQSPAWLLAARALQGVGAAVAAPSTLALLMTTFREGPERMRAVSLYSAVAGAGGSVGLVVGGMLTAWASWRWGMFINVPIGIALIWLAPRHLIETERRTGHFDLAGAVTSTAGMSTLVYAFVRAAAHGWGERGTIAAFTAAAALLTAFVLTERRAQHPITPLRLFASRERVGAYVARILVVGGMFSMFFFVTQFLQGVSGFSALQSGIAFLPMTVVLFGVVRVVPRFAVRVGGTTLLIAGLLVALTGMAWLSRITAGSAYFPQIAVPMVLLGAGIGAALTPLTSSGIAGVAAGDAGAASGLVNVAHQLGGSLGIGILVTVFAAAERSAPAADARHELAHAVAMSVTGSAVFLALALAVVVLVMRRPAAVPATVSLARVEGAR